MRENRKNRIHLRPRRIANNRDIENKEYDWNWARQDVTEDENRMENERNGEQEKENSNSTEEEDSQENMTSRSGTRIVRR